MESLPLEMYDAIFEHLHLIDLARLRQVCKKLKSIVQNYRIQELVMSDRSGVFNILAWADFGEYQNSCIIRPHNLKRTMPIQISIRSPNSVGQTDNSLFDPPNLFFDNSPTIRKLSVSTIFLRSAQYNVQFLKSLDCVCSGPETISLEEVNKFLHLERLKITFSWESSSNSTHGKLSLPKLKTLLLEAMGQPFSLTLEIEAPKCEGFHFCGYFTNDFKRFNLRFNFESPDSVKYLSLDSYDEVSHVFKNTEFLQICNQINSAAENLFFAFPRLKILKILNHKSLEELKRLFRLTRGRNVKLFFHGIELVNGKELDVFEESNFRSRPNLENYNMSFNYQYSKVLIDNYDRLEDDLNFVTDIEFSERIARLFEADADRFLRKFTNLSWVLSKTKIKEPKLFLKFLNSCQYLKCLNITNSGMPQEVFNQLENIKHLRYLLVKEETKINFSFISKMPFLKSLITNHHVDLKEEIKLGKDKRLGVFVIIEENLEIVIDKFFRPFDSPRYRLSIYKKDQTNVPSRQNYYSNNFEDLVRQYEELKNE